MTFEFKHYRFRVEYNGKAYSGWQIQPNVITVQQKLQDALQILCKHEVKIQGSGRTDTGVHAHGQVAQTQLSTNIALPQLQKSLNGILPPDISVSNLEECSSDFSARYHATSRHYRYAISLHKSPLALPQHWSIRYPIDISLLEKELKNFIGEYDFNSFSIPRDDGRSTKCEIFDAYLEKQGNLYFIHIKGNRFLHGMIRALVGHLIEIARKKLIVGDFHKIIAGEKDSKRIWAIPDGLSLYHVHYFDY